MTVLNKNNVTLLSISGLIIFTLGISFDNRVAISDSVQIIMEHESDDLPHLGIKYMAEDIKEIKTSIKELTEELQGQKIILCSHNGYHCSD